MFNFSRKKEEPSSKNIIEEEIVTLFKTAYAALNKCDHDIRSMDKNRETIGIASLATFYTIITNFPKAITNDQPQEVKERITLLLELAKRTVELIEESSVQNPYKTKKTD